MLAKTLKVGLFSILMSLLVFPALLHHLGIPFGKALRGWQAVPQVEPISWGNWSDGTWQAGNEAWLKRKMQSRHFFVRLNNQLKYSLFNELNAKDVVKGKNGYYFEERYIRSYLGMDYQGPESIKENIVALEEVSDSLAARNIPLLMVFASGKGTFMPENFPEPYDTIPKQTNNYETYLEAVKSSRIPYLDLNQYLLDMKDTASYALYTKGNTHWSAYALYQVVDTLLNKMEILLEEDLPDFSYGPVAVRDKARGEDAGIFDSFNLLWAKMDESYAYREWEVDAEGKYKPRVWVIGDSFYGTLFEEKIPHLIFEDASRFLYYFKEVWTHDDNRYRTKDIQNLKAWIEDLDMVMLFITDANIGACCWGMTGTFQQVFQE